MKQKLSLTSFTLYGFNYSFNLLKIVIIGYFFNPVVHHGIGIGYHFFWILLLNSIFAIFIAKAFNQAVQTHSTGSGGWFLFVRAWYGRKASIYSLLFHYLFYPVVICYLIVGLTRIEFYDLVQSWGPYKTAWLDLIGFAIYYLITALMWFGISLIKKALNTISWFGILVVCVLVGVLIKTIVSNNGVGWSLIQQNTNLSFRSFLKCFTSIFGFFLGMSAFTTLTGGVNNPPRNISRGTTIIVLMITLFSAVIGVLLVGSFTGQFNQNPFFKLNNSWWFKALIITNLTTSVGLEIIMHNLYTIEGELLPAAQYWIIPKSYLKRNHHGTLVRSLQTNLIFGTISAVFFLLIPDFIAGAKGLENPFNLATLLQVIAILAMIIYLVVISVVIRLKIQLHYRHVSWWWVGIWFLTSMFLVLSILGFSYELIEQLINLPSSPVLIYNICLLMYFGFTFTFPIIWYFVYYQPLTKKNQKIFKKLLVVKVIPFSESERFDILLKSIQTQVPEIIVKQQARQLSLDLKNYW